MGNDYILKVTLFVKLSVLDRKPLYKKRFDYKINSTLLNSEVFFADEIQGYDPSV